MRQVVPFSSNERRFNEKNILGQSIENPGPGAYSEVSKSIDDESKRRFKPFGSGIIRFKKLKPSDLPGPG
jgi:hypothetical protein